MNDLRAAAQAALEALELSAPDVRHANYAQTWDAIHGLRAALAQPQAEPFVVRHYSSEERPMIKGNGFDGLSVGEDREEAERFVAWLNDRLMTGT